MEAPVSNLLVKPHDFKLCQSCGVVNWYENEFCHFCEHHEFQEPGSNIAEYYEEEIDFLIEISENESGEEVSEEDVWDMKITI